MSRTATLLPLLCSLGVLACVPAAPRTTPAAAPDPGAFRAEVQTFLDGYTERYLELYTEANEAEWASNIRIVEGDDTNRKRTEAANEALAAFTGSAQNIERARAYLERSGDLEPLQVRQLRSILYKAANYPETVSDLVTRRIAAEAAQVETLFGFDFRLDGRSVTTNEIDDLLAASTDLPERLSVWAASKEVGRELRAGLAELVDLRNRTVQALGYDDYFAYQVSDYGMSTKEMMALNRRFVEEIWPLYRELHTWARYELAERYGAEVPELLPAHWLPNRWAQDWNEIVTVEGLDVDAVLATKDAEWVVEQAEDFYVSLGFDELPAVFWEKSSLYPLPPEADYKKNNHASAWHMDLQNDVRSLMSVQPNTRWWSTTHHELGHIYYYMSYTRPEVPPLLRGGANRGFHEAVGTLLGLASLRKPFLVERGLIDGDAETDEIQILLKEALDQVIFIPWSAGVMTHFERDLYAGLDPGEWNDRWWHYVRAFQGVEPPIDRSADLADPATKTHINDDPAQYYDYAFSAILLYQMHDHIAREILDQDPVNANYWGRKDVGAFLEGILKLGATRDWREVMREHLGEDVSASAMLQYYQPLLEYLREVNQGREHALPEKPAV